MTSLLHKFTDSGYISVSGLPNFLSISVTAFNKNQKLKLKLLQVWYC